MKSIFYVAIWAVGFVFCYVIFIDLIKPDTYLGESPGGWNRIKMERIVYDESEKPFIMVGTSMSFRLPAEALGPDMANWSLSGDSLMTGLQLVLKSNARPQAVLIETNVLDRSMNDEAVKDLFMPGISDLRIMLKGLRYEYRPVNLVYSKVLALARHIQLTSAGWLWHGSRDEAVSVAPVTHAAPLNTKEDSSVAANKTNTDAFENLLRLQRKEFDKDDDENYPKTISAHARSIREACEQLKLKGIKIYLFEMPAHRDIINSSYAMMARAVIADQFPASEYPRIKVFDDGDTFSTTDGVHLKPEDAKIVADRIYLALQRSRGIPARFPAE